MAASYALLSTTGGHQVDLSTLVPNTGNHGLLKITEGGTGTPANPGWAVPALAVAATTTSAGDYQAGSTTLSGIAGITFITGDLLVANTGIAGAMQRLAVGAANTILASTGTTPAWVGGTAASGNVLTYNGSAVVWAAPSTGGTVTSVALASAGGTPITYSGSPITTSGTITLTLGTVTTANGGTGVTSFTAGQMLYYASGTALSTLGIGAANTIMASSGSAPSWVGGTAASGNVLTYNGTNVVWAAPATGGTVTSVALSSTGSTIAITGSPITTSGTINVDINTVAVAKGGTNITSYTAGQMLYASASTTLSTLNLSGTAHQVLTNDGSTAPTWSGGSASSGNVLTYNGTSVTWAAPSGGLSFVSVAGTTQAMAVNTAYFCNNGSLTTLTLPATAALGAMFYIFGPSLYSIAQNAGQSIIFGNQTTTTGTGGSITSTNAGDVIPLICTVADTTFQVMGGVGSGFTIV